MEVFFKFPSRLEMATVLWVFFEFRGAERGQLFTELLVVILNDYDIAFRLQTTCNFTNSN